MNFNRDYWVELLVPDGTGKSHVTAEDISHFNVIENVFYFYRGLNVILAVPVCNVLFFGSKERVRETGK